MRIQITLFAALVASACSSTPTVDSAPAPRLQESVTKEELAIVEGAGEGASNTALAKQTQNPVANLISLPIQNNTDGGIGPNNAKQNTTNIQPVWPFPVSEDWNLITRTILPVVYQEQIIPNTGTELGFGDTTFTAFLSPAQPGSVTWGAGPIVLMPTSTDRRLGAGEWGLGLSGLVLTTPGKWVVGGLVSNVWSFEGAVNLFTLQPFVNYNIANGWYVVSAPIMTANWEAESGEQWKVPLGAGAGKVFKVGKLPINCSVQYYDYVTTPTYGPDWQLRLQVQFLFPK